jgi:hypothetical protein
MDGRRQEAELEIREVLRALLPLLLLAGCGQDDAPPPAEIDKKAEAPQQATVPAPGEPGGLPDDGTPLSEAPATPGGAQEAATVLETYYGLIEAGKYREAWKLRSTERGGNEAAFVESFGKYASYRANVGAPSKVAGQDGWLYVEVPVQIYGQTKSGEGFSSAGSVTLRRRDKGSAAERQWRVYS